MLVKSHFSFAKREKVGARKCLWFVLALPINTIASNRSEDVKLLLGDGVPAPPQFDCWRLPLFSQFLDAFEGLVHAINNEGQFMAMHLDPLSRGLAALDDWLRDFERRGHSGLAGWLDVFGGLQSCPLVFVAAELSLAMGIWKQGLLTMSTVRRLDPYRVDSSQRVHYTRAVEIANSWRRWFQLSGEQFLQPVGRFAELCRRSSLHWPAVNDLAAIALHGMSCLVPQESGSLRFSDLLGCAPAPDVHTMCAARRAVELDFPLASLQSFWHQVHSALLSSMTLPMPWGFLDGVPHLMVSLLPEVAVPLPVAGEPLFLEFGVFNASSLNFIARSLETLARHHGTSAPIVYGFDSFQGLPTDWRRDFAAGNFHLAGQIPPVASNVRLIPGWFNETIPAFFADVSRKSLSSYARFVHIDCDLYDSTRAVLFAIALLLRPGTVIVFDELVNYPGFEFGELGAFFAFLREYPWNFRVLYAPWHVLSDHRDFIALEASGISDNSLHQVVAIELVSEVGAG